MWKWLFLTTNKIAHVFEGEGNTKHSRWGNYYKLLCERSEQEEQRLKKEGKPGILLGKSDLRSQWFPNFKGSLLQKNLDFNIVEKLNQN